MGIKEALCITPAQTFGAAGGGVLSLTEMSDLSFLCFMCHVLRRDFHLAEIQSRNMLRLLLS
jgi:hypothetical protein